MANWCRYLQGSSSYWCERTGEYPSYSMINTYCKNGGYGCSHYHVSTAVEVVLRKGIKKEDLPEFNKTFAGIRNLRKKLEKDENYANFIEMYDNMGPALAEKILTDKESKELSTKLYSIMNRVTTFVEKGKEDRATDYYCKMVGALVNKYNLGELYNTEADFINKKNKDAKKVQKLTKTIEK